MISLRRHMASNSAVVEPGRPHVLLGVLALRRALGQLGGQPHRAQLAGHAGGHVQVPDQLHPPGDQPGLLLQLAHRELGRVLGGAFRRGAGRELPAPLADRVAELLDQVQPIAVARDDQRVGRLVDHAVDAVGAVGAPDPVLAHRHPAVRVDLTAAKRFHSAHGAKATGGRAGGGRLYARAGAPRHRPLPGGLRRPAHRAPAHGPAAAAGQGGRIGERARRRPGLQAAELDEPAVLAGGAAGASGRCATRPTSRW